MLEKSFGLFFFLKQPKNQKSDERYVYVRITVDGISKELSLKRVWFADRWNQSSGRATGTKEDAKSLNTNLDAIAAKIYQAKIALLEANKTVSAEALKNVVTGTGEDKKMLLEIFSKQIDEIKSLVGTDYAYKTLQKRNTTYTHTKAFINWKYNKPDIEINDLTMSL